MFSDRDCSSRDNVFRDHPPVQATSLQQGDLAAGESGGVRITGGWDFLSYVLFFVFGYALFANQQALSNVRKYAFWTTGAAAALTVFYLGTRYGMGGVIPGLTSHDVTGGQVDR